MIVLLNGLFLCLLGLDQLNSPSKAATLFFRPTSLRKAITACNDRLVAKNLVDDVYELFLEFPDSALTLHQQDFFDFTRQSQAAVFFWETEQIHPEFHCHDGAGRDLDLDKLTSYGGFCFSRHAMGQLFGKIDNRLHKEKIFFLDIHVNDNCKKFLNLQPSIHLRSTASNSIVTARLGVTGIVVYGFLTLIKFLINATDGTGGRRKAP